MVACEPKAAHCERGGFAGPMTSVSPVLPLSLSGTSTIVGRSGGRSTVGGGDGVGNLALCLTSYCFFGCDWRAVQRGVFRIVSYAPLFVWCLFLKA